MHYVILPCQRGRRRIIAYQAGSPKRSRCLGAMEEWREFVEALKTHKIFLDADENRVQRDLASVVERCGL
jgi:hypothetical protein